MCPFVRRAQDILLSALTIIVLSPLLVLISLLIMLDDSSAEPVFCQKRCGKALFWQAQQGRCQLSFEEWGELDLQYIRERSWLLDWKLMVLTVKNSSQRW